MLAKERRQNIKELVLEKKGVKVAELAEMFDVTDETIRRDLNVLEKEGVLLRGYGGAFIQTGVENVIDSDIRQSVYIENKKKIAVICDTLIQNGDVIFFDTSTTAYYVAEQIVNKRLTVLTNSLRITNLLSKQPNIRLVCIGGHYNKSEMGFFGLNAFRSLGDYYVDKSFVSCRSLSIENGITESIEETAALKIKAIERSKECYIIADYTKFENTSFLKISGYGSITGIITDKQLSERWHNEMKKKNVKVFDR
ncbi:DeoR/GlpR family DNA-binding transcription regulator [Oceanobacillus sp. Castelsardo]|uniref:DeoR/GlpR family DNA-binding transcription regulator n=1 Tax=Oceanobacillus sp. Castelsardo TaxID=1851204 RepID=UPI000838889B|nr:DeoR/GlpR family DNA-binding transcription regulator [Oceanobacillus sp. Castelsardo]